HKSGEGRIDLAAGAGIKDLNLQSDGASSRLHVSQRGLLSRSSGRIDEHGDTSRARHHLTQEFKPLCGQLTTEKIDPCQVAARPREARDQAQPDRVLGDDKDDGNCRGGGLGGKRGGRAHGGDRDRPVTNQLVCQLRQSIELILGPAVFDRHVLALDVAYILQALAKCAQTVRHPGRRSVVKKPDHWHCWLLRARRERPCRCAAEQRDKVAPPHSITSSARARKDSGIVRPIAFAALTFTTSSNLVAWSTGRSAGEAPLRMRPT